MGDLIKLKDLTVSYQRHPALHHVSGSIAKGSMTAILGPNGGGKSTFLKAIKQLIRSSNGELTFHGIAPKHIAYMPQYHQLDLHFPVTVMELVLLGFWQQKGLFGKIDHDCYHKAQAALADVRLSGFENRPVNTLSVGQLQRVLFARVIVQNAPVICMDEPFSAVDSTTTEILLKMLKRWNREGRTLLVVLHEMDQALEYFPESILLARELIGWGPTKKVLCDANLKKARLMTEAWDEDAPACEVHAS